MSGYAKYIENNNKTMSFKVIDKRLKSILKYEKNKTKQCNENGIQ